MKTENTLVTNNRYTQTDRCIKVQRELTASYFTLMSYTDQSVQRRFNSNTPITVYQLTTSCRGPDVAVHNNSL